MKVMCIDERETTSGWLVFGKTYSVLRDDDFSFCYPVYYLSERPGVPYCKMRFIPLSDIDETERLNKKQLCIQQ